MFVGGLYQIVVAIHKLDESALGNHHTIVSSHAGSLVRLAQIDDLRQIFREPVDCTDIASIIHEDDFSFLGIERELEDAFDAFLQIFRRHIVSGDDETY